MPVNPEYRNFLKFQQSKDTYKVAQRTENGETVWVKKVRPVEDGIPRDEETEATEEEIGWIKERRMASAVTAAKTGIVTLAQLRLLVKSGRLHDPDLAPMRLAIIAKALDKAKRLDLYDPREGTFKFIDASDYGISEKELMQLFAPKPQSPKDDEEKYAEQLRQRF